ncbi:MAG: hypothetical protein H0T60_02335 [Acidobacteria bacterium]|nr:hypothetical protein [Acidobacteriota bacterium]
MKCQYCEELIIAGDDFEFVNDGAATMHRECMLRTVIGSADHVRRGPHPVGTCEPDDPRLTKREAARSAVEACRARAAAERRDEIGMMEWPSAIGHTPAGRGFDEG